MLFAVTFYSNTDLHWPIFLFFFNTRRLLIYGCGLVSLKTDNIIMLTNFVTTHSFQTKCVLAIVNYYVKCCKD